ncbi:MAG: serine hydrolase domain-containing protein [Candidatus Eisenbacteria bacterium]
MIRAVWWCVLLACAAGLAAESSAAKRPVAVRAPADDRRAAERLLTRIDSLRIAGKIPGLAVVILRDTTVLAARGLGRADLERGIAVTPDTPFNIASVTKPIAAVVALRLVESGTLDLDRSMRSFARFPAFCTDVREAGGIFFSDYACEDTALTLRHLLSMTANGAPGTRFFYNPVSYSWTSRPMAEVSGVPFSTLVDSFIFRPAGMTRSARLHRRLPLPPGIAADLALPYHVDSTGRWALSEPPGPQGDGAAGGVISTARDLARFDIALTRGVLLDPASLGSMWHAGRSAAGVALPYGLGWFVAPLAGETAVWHTGLWEGAYSALYLKLPARKLTLILLANSDGLRWDSRLDEAAIERSPFAQALIEAFPR